MDEERLVLSVEACDGGMRSKLKAWEVKSMNEKIYIMERWKMRRDGGTRQVKTHQCRCSRCINEILLMEEQMHRQKEWLE
jgi:hypothetical protein